MQRHNALWLMLLWRKVKKKIKCMQVLIRLMLWFGFTHVCELKFVNRFVCRFQPLPKLDANWMIQS
ncbi:hypothetical protein Hanom_Chr01g00074631 [Helianthus anomalus]